MTQTTRKFHHVLASALALSFASAGCAMSVEPEAAGPELAEVASTEQALSCQGDCPEGIESTVLTVGPNEYFIVYRTTLDAPAGKVWSRVKNFKKLVSLAFGDLVSDFEWIDGGPGQIPSLVQFNLGEQTIVEEVTYRSNSEKELRYRVAETPVLGIEEYTAEVNLTPCAEGTVIEMVREMTLSPEADIDSFLPLFEMEVNNIRVHFNGPE